MKLLFLLAALVMARAETCAPLKPQSDAFANPTSPNGITAPPLLPLVKAVEESKVFPDSKTIVDMPLKAPVAEVAGAFNQLQLPNDADAKNETLKNFLQQWLSPAGTELEPTTTNFTDQPPPEWFDDLSDPQIRDWADALYEIWGTLARQLVPEVSAHPELYTMLPVPNPFVIPGARFREVYYWDTYWVLKGLLASNLTELSEDIIGNFIHLISTYGHIPNGIRTYYLNRSQPPLFSEMVRIVYEATDNNTLLSEAMPALLQEHEFWTSPPKQVMALADDGQEYNVTRYYANWTQPRPESYSEDLETVRKAGLNPDNADDPAVQQLYRDLASAAESGWDFSTRWFRDGKTLPTTRTTMILPADLNGYMLQMESNIADFAAELGCTDVEQKYRQLAMDRQDALNALFWNNQTAMWHDLICTPQQGNGAAAAPAAEASAGQAPLVCQVEQNPAVFASNFIPLFAGAAEPDSAQALAAVEALNSSGLIGIGGVAVSLTNSGQQWDFPNVWPPVEWMMIDGSQRFGGAAGEALAQELAANFLATAFAGWEEKGAMVEKFNATTIGGAGGGGEYTVVTGFGWTNGVVLDLLQRFGWE